VLPTPAKKLKSDDERWVEQAVGVAFSSTAGGSDEQRPPVLTTRDGDQTARVLKSLDNYCSNALYLVLSASTSSRTVHRL